MELNKEEILGRTLKEYLSKTHCEEIEDMIDIYTFTTIVYATLKVLNDEIKIDKEPTAIRDTSCNIKGYETKRLYIDADKIADIIGEHIYNKLREAMIKKGY